MIPPNAAPPPAITAVRLPLPFAVNVRMAVCTGISAPFTFMESTRSDSTAPPANLPSGFASTTVPVTVVPRGMATTLSAITSLAIVAVKVWPDWLSLEPRAEPRATVMVVLAGTMMGCLLASSAPFFELRLSPSLFAALLSGVPLVFGLALLELSVAGLLVQPRLKIR